MAPGKRLKDFDENLKKAGAAIGQFLARSQAKLEKTGSRAIKSTEKLVDTMARRAEHTVESTVEKIHEATAPSDDHDHKPSPARFSSIKNKAISESVLFLATDIIDYLTDNGKTTVAELQMIMEKRRRNPGMTFAALGWLVGENKVHITRNGENISLK